MTAAASTIETGNLEIKADVSIDDTGTVTGIAWIQRRRLDWSR